MRITTMFARKAMTVALAMACVVGLGTAALATTINVDFGVNTQTTAGNWNNVGGNTGVSDFGSKGAGLTGGPFVFAGLIDDTGAATGITLTMQATTAGTTGAGTAGSGANYDSSSAGWTSYPAAVSGMPTSALQDGIYTKPPSEEESHAWTATLSGLNALATYDILVYGARGNNGGDANWEVTGGNGVTNLYTAAILDNATSVPSVLGVTADGSGEITIVLDAPAAAGNSSWNILQVTETVEVPEPASLLLLGLGGLALVARRKR